MSTRHLYGGAAAFAILAGAATEAWAQSTTTLQEVVVTSQKREQRLQEVPISVTAFTQKQIVANRIESVHDLGSLAPNLFVQESPGAVNLPVFSLRGVQSNGAATGSDKEVSIYLDGVYLGSSTGSMFDVADIARIEVLKGPQGTLFGRNATAGAISITTRDPAGAFKFHQELTGGNYDQFRSKTRIDFPSWGPLSAAVTYVHSQRRGDVKNLGAGTVWDYRPVGYGIQVSPSWLGSHDLNAVTAALKLKAMDNLTFTYKFDWAEDHATPVANGLGYINPLGLGAGFFVGSVLDGLAPIGPVPNPPQISPSRPTAVNNNFDIPSYNNAQGHNLTAVWKPLDSLTVKNILEYREADEVAANEIDGIGGLTATPLLALFGKGPVGAPYYLLSNTTVDTTKQWSDELQATYDSKFLTLTTGAIYYWSKETHNGIGGSNNSNSFTPFPGFVINTQNIPTSHVEQTSEAFYIQPEFHLTPQLDLTTGYRITHDHKNNFFASRNGAAGPLTTVASTYGDTKPSALISLDYKITPDIMVYGKYSLGYMSGGQSFGLVYQPEIAKSWEGGFKSEFFDHRVRLNFAAWTAHYTNLQAPTSGTILHPAHPEWAVIVINNGNLSARGFEIESAFVPVTGLTLDAGMGFTSSHYTYVNPLISGGSPWFPPVERPIMTANLSAEYESKPVWKDAYVTARLDSNFRGRMYISITLPNGTTPGFITPGTGQDPSMWLLNGRLALTHIAFAHGTGEVALWGRNLTNAGNVEFGVGISFLQSLYYQQARTFGVDLTYDF
jgi:iron complex outermembrane receptor protein